MATLYPFNTPTQDARRAAVLREGCGFFADTFPIAASAGSTIAVSGSIYFQALGLLAGDIITNVLSAVQTAGATLTLTKVGIYTKAGTLLSSSADASAAFLSTGPKTTPLLPQTNGAPLVIPIDDLYYAAFICVGTTPPTMYRGLTGGNSNTTFTGASGPRSGLQSGQSDLITSATIAGSVSAIYFWHGIS
jgi:hypothetical protein